jgi:hypothetical protein
MRISDGPMIFSSETNPLMREISKGKSKLKGILGKVGSSIGADDSEDEEDLSSFLSGAKLGKGGAPMYDPKKMYGSLYSLYGVRPVRGGLLGE